MDTRPIGIFDSGLGGLSVVKEIIKILPHEDLVYLGDTARVPYGTRSKETIIKFSLEDANFLLQKNVKCIIIACNTASSMAGKILKKKSVIPVFDVVGPALSDARKMSKGRIGVIGTRATINSGAYNVDFSQACPLLVPFIEEGETESRALEIIVKNYLKSMKGNKVNALILGCTHYPLIGNLIQKEVGKDVRLINPGKSVSKKVFEYMTQNKMLNAKKTRGKRIFFMTDLTDRFTKVAEVFLGEKIEGSLRKAVLSK